MNCRELNSCLCCESGDLQLIFDLGAQSPVNNYSHKEKYPLKLNRCRSCDHLQLSHSVNPEILFSEYPYQSGVSKTMLEYFSWFVDKALKYFPDAKSILDIACNDGSQLDYFKAKNLETFCVEPSKNLYEISQNKGHESSNSFFPSSDIDRNFDIITAQNVFAHTPAPYEFLLGCKDVMHEDSILFIQTSQAEMLEMNEYDTIYHEHISFFNVNSMNILISRAGLVLKDMFKADIHGGSYVFVIKKNRGSSFDRFSIKSQVHAEKIRAIIRYYREKGYGVAGYGASAKLINLINYAKIPIDFIVDDTEFKQGCKVSNFNIPVVSNDQLTPFDAPYLWIPTWNFFDEIKSKIKSKPVDKLLRVFPEIELI